MNRSQLPDVQRKAPTLGGLLARARREGWATAHFNISNLEQMRVVVQTCAALSSPAMVGVSEGERSHVGLIEAVALRDAFRREFSIPIYLNADHSKSVATAKAAVDAGFDSIHIDLSALPIEENITATAEVVRYARSKDPRISVEGELGLLKGESRIQTEKISIQLEDLTRPDEARSFVKRTGVDRLAPSVGNAHGIAPDEPALDIERIQAIRHLISEEVALVLHGGSGIPAGEIKAAIAAGIVNIHINTEIRVAFVGGLRHYMEVHPEETTPYKIYPEAEVAMQKVIEDKLHLFGALNRI